MKLGPDDERLIWSLWARAWSAKEIANYMAGGPHPEVLRAVIAVLDDNPHNREER